MLGIILAATITASGPPVTSTTRESFPSTACNELDLTVQSGADVKAVDALKHDFDKFIADSKKKCGLKGMHE